jgi:endonuclease/exonuclease/phosphatase family metal-dependent hydrolase
VATLRIVSYNIHGQRDDQAALDEVVRDLAPDVLVLQEAPRRFRWRQHCAALARRFRLVYAVGGLPALGNLILVDLRVSVEHTWCLRFPLTPGRLMRGAAVARCAVAGRRFVVAGSHLSTDPLERPTQARRLRQELATEDDPLVLALDVNDEPESETWKVLADGLVDAGAGPGTPTFPALDPRRRIDTVLVDPRLPVTAHRVVDAPVARRASDHLPVLTELTI